MIDRLYLQQHGRAVGPYPRGQVQGMVRDRTIKPEHPASATPEGPWQPVRILLEAAAEAGEAGPELTREGEDFPLETGVTRFIDRVVNFFVALFWDSERPADAYFAFQNKCCRVGSYSLLTCGFLGLILAGIHAARTNSGIPLIAGITFAVVMLLGHYLALKFAHGILDLLHGDRVELGSSTVPKAVAVLFTVGVLLCLLRGLTQAADLFRTDLRGALLSLFVALASATVFSSVAILAKECGVLLNIDSAPKRLLGGTLFLNLAKFIARLGLASSLILFAAVGWTAAFSLSVAVFLLAFAPFSDPIMLFGLADFSLNPNLVFSYVGLSAGANLAVAAAWIPILFYLGYLFQIVVIDLCSAVLQIARNTRPGG